MTGEELLRREKARGKAEDVLELLSDCGTVPTELVDRIFEERNSETLKKWLRLASNAKTLEEFQEKM